MIERFVTPFDDADMRNIAICIHYKAACHPSFNTLVISLCRILSVFVDIVEKSLVATRKCWFHFHKVIFKHFFESLQSIPCQAGRHSACLRPGVKKAQGKKYYGCEERNVGRFHYGCFNCCLHSFGLLRCSIVANLG